MRGPALKETWNIDNAADVKRYTISPKCQMPTCTAPLSTTSLNGSQASTKKGKVYLLKVKHYYFQGNPLICTRQPSSLHTSPDLLSCRGEADSSSLRPQQSRSRSYCCGPSSSPVPQQQPQSPAKALTTAAPHTFSQEPSLGRGNKNAA